MFPPLAHLTEVFLYFLVGIILAIPTLYFNTRFAYRLGMMDWPKARGLAEDQNPIVGYGLTLIVLSVLGFLTHFYNLSPWLLTTLIIITVMGHFDDRKSLPATEKLFWQAVCAISVVYSDPTIHTLLSIKYGGWGSILGVFFILGLVNALNFIDGIDGLAGTVIFFGAFAYIAFSVDLSSNAPHLICSAIIMGVMVPFLYANVWLRRGFLGNVGSYFFSYLLAVMHLSAPVRADEPLARIALLCLCFPIPIADSTVVIMSRLLTFRSPFRPDKCHLHHRLMQTGIPLRYILITFGLIEFGGVVTAAILNQLPQTINTLFALTLVLNFVGITGLLVLMIEKCSKKRLQSYISRMCNGESVYYLKYKIQTESGKMPSRNTLRRIEAKVAADIRVTDVCYTEHPQTLVVVLKSSPELLKTILARMEKTFVSEKTTPTLLLEQGQFLRKPTRYTESIERLSA